MLASFEFGALDRIWFDSGFISGCEPAFKSSCGALLRLPNVNSVGLWGGCVSVRGVCSWMVCEPLSQNIWPCLGWTSAALRDGAWHPSNRGGFLVSHPHVSRHSGTRKLAFWVPSGQSVLFRFATQCSFRFPPLMHFPSFNTFSSFLSLVSPSHLLSPSGPFAVLPFFGAWRRNQWLFLSNIYNPISDWGSQREHKSRVCLTDWISCAAWCIIVVLKWIS